MSTDPGTCKNSEGGYSCKCNEGAEFIEEPHETCTGR